MSDGKVVLIDFKEHERMQFGAMLVSSETLDIIVEMAFYIDPREIEKLLKRPRDPPKRDSYFKKIHDMLNNQIWIGHDIIKRDIPGLLALFKKVGAKFPTPKSVIDTVLFTSSNTSRAKLAVHFGLGEDKGAL
ncbi:unnamed protein product [Microthlaspi erraticum]|uniref:Exonuclease domain-containing protein n=1 Tax=Microthlaspi erraticum TaxID=1685480 RepID=A0A6D2I201_9BRAS|nr:unnamed protein product [Microthlaspi erraticum]